MIGRPIPLDRTFDFMDVRQHVGRLLPAEWTRNLDPRVFRVDDDRSNRVDPLLVTELIPVAAVEAFIDDVFSPAVKGREERYDDQSRCYPGGAEPKTVARHRLHQITDDEVRPRISDELVMRME